jgi:hypothetical protein
VSTDRQRISGFALGVNSGNINMILEVAILNTRPGESADFARAFAEAQGIRMGVFNGLVKRISGCEPSTDAKSDKRTETDMGDRHSFEQNHI